MSSLAHRHSFTYVTGDIIKHSEEPFYSNWAKIGLIKEVD